MKNIFKYVSTILFVYMLLGCNSGNTNSGKDLFIETIRTDSGEIVINDPCDEYHYDNDGYMVKQILYWDCEKKNLLWDIDYENNEIKKLTTYYENGGINKKENYIEGKKDGVWMKNTTDFLKKVNIENYIYYDSFKEPYEYIWYYDNGIIINTLMFHPTGIIKQEKIWNNNEIMQIKFWDKKGLLCKEERYYNTNFLDTITKYLGKKEAIRMMDSTKSKLMISFEYDTTVIVSNITVEWVE